MTALKIKQLTEGNRREYISPGDREEPLATVRRLDSVSSPLAPNELGKSSRHHRVDVVLQRYGLELDERQET